VAEAVRNLACVGAEPIGVTDCLNFGSPESPRVMGQFVAAVEGMAEACREFEVPVVSGNVSFYNETSGCPILPTPTVGMVGVVPEVRSAPRCRLEPGDIVFVLGAPEGALGATRYLQAVLGIEGGPVPAVDFAAERRAAAIVRALVRAGLVAAKDITDGGLAGALVELSGGTTGATIAVPEEAAPARVLFGEWRGRYVLAAPPQGEAAVARACAGAPLARLGTAGGQELVVRRAETELVREKIAALYRLREGCLGWLLSG